MKSRPAPITQTSIDSALPSGELRGPAAPVLAIESVDAVVLDDVTGGCRRCGCGTQVAYSYQSGGGLDPSRLALAFAFSSMLSQNK